MFDSWKQVVIPIGIVIKTIGTTSDYYDSTIYISKIGVEKIHKEE